MTTFHSFARFGIDHLSPSAINHWIDYPRGWAERYINKTKDPANPTLWRGTAVENGLQHHLLGRSFKEAYDAAHQSFHMNAEGKETVAEELEAQAELIGPMLEQALKWQPPGPLNAVQIKVEHFFDPIPIPVQGWVDFGFDGVDIDLKTTEKIPSAPRPDHIRQVAFYSAARGRSAGLLYVSAKRFQYYDVSGEDLEIGLEQLRGAALTLYNHLARCDTRDDVIKALPENPEHWRAKKPKAPISYVDALTSG